MKLRLAVRFIEFTIVAVTHLAPTHAMILKLVGLVHVSVIPVALTLVSCDACADDARASRLESRAGEA